jgi:hypothetical protein
VPNSGDEPPQDHEEGTIQEETADTPCGPGAALPGIAVILALLRIVEILGSWAQNGADLPLTSSTVPGSFQ